MTGEERVALRAAIDEARRRQLQNGPVRSPGPTNQVAAPAVPRRRVSYRSTVYVPPPAWWAHGEVSWQRKVRRVAKELREAGSVCVCEDMPEQAAELIMAAAHKCNGTAITRVVGVGGCASGTLIHSAVWPWMDVEVGDVMAG